MGKCFGGFTQENTPLHTRSQLRRITAMTKRAMSKQRKRKSNKDSFESEEEYKRFAEKRNAATKRCRAKGNAERKFLKEENARLREEIELLRVEGGLGDLYWRNKAEELRKELKERDNQLTEKISRIAFLEKEMQDYKQSGNSDASSGTATLYYTSEVNESSNVVAIDIAEIFDSAVVDIPSQALDFTRL